MSLRGHKYKKITRRPFFTPGADNNQGEPLHEEQSLNVNIIDKEGSRYPMREDGRYGCGQ